MNPNQSINFSVALEILKKGKSVARSGWNGKGMFITLQIPDENSKMSLPYMYITYPEEAVNTPGARCPWLASQTDLLAEDWYVVGE